MSRGVLTAVSGFSGSGKGTIMKKFMERYPHYSLSVSCTTRRPRTGEKDGVHYFFKTDEEFLLMIENDEFIEYAGYAGHYYGTPKSYVEECLAEGKDIILEIEVQGALQIKELFPEAVLIFVTAPSVKEIERRLRSRGTETEEEIQNRLKQIEREMDSVGRYDYLVINDSVEESVEIINGIIAARHCEVKNNTEFLERFRSEGGF